MCKDKQPFTLIEVLICIFLITLIAVPLSRHPMLLFKNEITALKDLETDRFAELAYLEVLKKKTPDWNKLREGITYQLPSYKLELKGINSFTFTPQVALTVARPKVEMDETLRLVNCQITFSGSKKKYLYKYLVEKQEICNDQ